MASSSSPLDPSSTLPLRRVSFDEIMKVSAAHYEQRWMLCNHYMYMADDIFFYLHQAGLVQQIINVFKMENQKKRHLDQIKGKKRIYDNVEDDADIIVDCSEHGQLKQQKSRQSTVVDHETQTDDGLLMVSSSPMSTVTVAPTVDIDAELEKKSYQRSLLVTYKIYLRKCDFSLLENHGIIDRLVQIIENFGHTYGRSFDQYLSSRGSIVSTTAVTQERNEDTEDSEDEEDDEDDDYEFPKPSEDEDEEDDNNDQGGTQCGCCMPLKEYDYEYKEDEDLIHIDASTQTINN